MNELSPPTPRPSCGTPSGPQQHRRYGEKPCDDCRVARRDYVRWRRAVARGDAPEDPKTAERRDKWLISRAQTRAREILADRYIGQPGRLVLDEEYDRLWRSILAERGFCG